MAVRGPLEGILQMFAVLLRGCCVRPLLQLPVQKRRNPYLVRARNELSHLHRAKFGSLEPKEMLPCWFSRGQESRDHTTDMAVGLLVLVCVVCCCCNELTQTTHVLSYCSEGQDTTQARLAGCHTLGLEYFSKVNWLKTC